MGSWTDNGGGDTEKHAAGGGGVNPAAVRLPRQEAAIEGEYRQLEKPGTVDVEKVCFAVSHRHLLTKA